MTSDYGRHSLLLSLWRQAHLCGLACPIPACSGDGHGNGCAWRRGDSWRGSGVFVNVVPARARPDVADVYFFITDFGSGGWTHELCLGGLQEACVVALRVFGFVV